MIEAVFEELSIKQQVFADLEKHVPPTCVLATNTSSLSVTEMAADLEHPERVVGFHFFNPVAVLPLLEVVRGPATDDATLATALAVAKHAEEERGAGQGRDRLRGQPAAAADDGRGLRRGRRGHADPGRRRGAEAARPADAAVRAAAAGRAADRAARGREPARGLRRPLPGLGQPAGRSSRPSGPGSTTGRRTARRTSGRDRRCSRSATGRAPPSRSASGPWTRWPRRSG